jgi:hypothetical protein
MSDSKELQQASRRLRKLVAAKGRLSGHFFIALADAGAQAVLVVTLAARDDGGQKCLALGRTLRRALPGAKSAQGTVTMEGAKLTFSIQRGPAPITHIKRAFRGTLSSTEQGGLDALRVLKKAAIRSAAGDDEAGESLTDDEQETLSAGALDAGELAWLAERQETLAHISAMLQKRPPTKTPPIEEAVAQIDVLEEARAEGHDITEALREARAALARQAAVGESPTSSILDAPFRQLIEASSDASLVLSLAQLRDLERRYETLQAALGAGTIVEEADLERILMVLRRSVDELVGQLHLHRLQVTERG